MKYRPISPKQAWTSVHSSEMTLSERFLLLYLLTSPMSNLIGCFPLVPRIAAAQMNTSVDELANGLDRLEKLNSAIYRDGWVLVRTWFHHNMWESTFAGNVAKAIPKELVEVPTSLLPLWIRSCLDARVPQEVLDRVMGGLGQSPFQGACKGLDQQNKTETDTEKELQTDMTAGGALKLHSSPADLSLHLTVVAKRHKLTTDQERLLAKALSEQFANQAIGKAKPILNLEAWLRAVAANISSQHSEATDRLLDGSTNRILAPKSEAQTDLGSVQLAQAMLGKLEEDDLALLRQRIRDSFHGKCLKIGRAHV